MDEAMSAPTQEDLLTELDERILEAGERKIENLRYAGATYRKAAQAWARRREILEAARQQVADYPRIAALLHSPEVEAFGGGVQREAAHQRARWGAAHDRGKSAESWYWLVGHLAGKALRASIQGDREKALHHTISAAAALAHWHAAIKADQSGQGLGADADLQAIEGGP